MLFANLLASDFPLRTNKVILSKLSKWIKSDNSQLSILQRQPPVLKGFHLSNRPGDPQQWGLTWGVSDFIQSSNSVRCSLFSTQAEEQPCLFLTTRGQKIRWSRPAELKAKWDTQPPIVFVSTRLSCVYSRVVITTFWWLREREVKGGEVGVRGYGGKRPEEVCGLVWVSAHPANW